MTGVLHVLEVVGLTLTILAGMALVLFTDLVAWLIIAFFVLGVPTLVAVAVWNAT